MNFSRGPSRHGRGFTLIELMIAVSIVAILAAIALPSYRDYVIRGQLVDATTGLSQMRARMEQYYQDNRTYLASGGFTPPCATTVVVGNFAIDCAIAPPTNPATFNLSATGYTVSANGGGSVAGFTFTIDQTNSQRTTSVPSGWGATPANCWVIKRGATC